MQNTVTFYDNPWIDLSSFGFKTDKKEYKFYSGKFDSYAQYVTSNNPLNGFYGFTVSKNQIKNVISIKIFTFD